MAQTWPQLLLVGVLAAVLPHGGLRPSFSASLLLILAAPALCLAWQLSSQLGV